MTDNVENLILEHLRALRGSMDRMEERMGRVEDRVSSLGRHTAVLVSDVAGVRVSIDQLDRRVDRIEKRLDLVDAPLA